MHLFDQLTPLAVQQGTILTTLPVEIPGIEGARPISLYLPPDFDESSGKRYPVAYFFDGQNLFDGHPSGWPVGWQLHRILDARWSLGVTVPIVIGIHHGPMRDEELSPWQVEPGQTPRGDWLLDWIVNDLHPEMLRSLPLIGTREQTLLGGSSLGGLMALYGAVEYSDVFGQALSMSPSLWVADGEIGRWLAGHEGLSPGRALRLYVDTGKWEGKRKQGCGTGQLSLVPERLGDDPCHDARVMVELLEARGLVQGFDFCWDVDRFGRHTEYHWSKRLPLALDFLYDQAACEAGTDADWEDEQAA